MFNQNATLVSRAYLRWFRFPSDVWVTLLAIFPIIFTQFIQKLLPIIDNHYLNLLGTQALFIHNIQYSFIYIGQYIGGATATSCLIFWKRAEYAKTQKSVFLLHIGLCIAASLICAMVAIYYTNPILAHFSVDPHYLSLAKIYFHIGLANMVLQAIYLALGGMIIATGQEKLSLVFSCILLALNIIIDNIATHILFSGIITPQYILSAMLTIGLSMTLFLIILNSVMGYLIIKKADNWRFPNIHEIFKIWSNELGSALIAGIYPIVYAFQLAVIKSSGSLLITYQLILQFTSLICIPLMATMQIALRDASLVESQIISAHKQEWRNKLFYFGLFPVQLLLMLGMVSPVWCLQSVYGYIVPTDHQSFIILFFVATMIGQVGNALTVPIRAKKNSYLITISYFFADVLFMLGGMQLIIFLDYATPTATGYVTLIYVIAYLFINLYFASRKQKL